MNTRNFRASVIVLLAVAAMASALPGTGRADERVFDKKTPRNPNDIIYGGRGVSDHSAVGAICSLIIPGIGQAINHNETKKIVTHGIVGLLYFAGLVNPIGWALGLFHIWSCWDALIDRQGGYINGCVQAPESWNDVSTGEAVLPAA